MRGLARLCHMWDTQPERVAKAAGLMEPLTDDREIIRQALATCDPKGDPWESMILKLRELAPTDAPRIMATMMQRATQEYDRESQDRYRKNMAANAVKYGPLFPDGDDGAYQKFSKCLMDDENAARLAHALTLERERTHSSNAWNQGYNQIQISNHSSR